MIKGIGEYPHIRGSGGENTQIGPKGGKYVSKSGSPTLKNYIQQKGLCENDNDKSRKTKQELQSKYIFTVNYRKGAIHVTPDALSRSLVDDTGKEECTTIDFRNLAAMPSDIGIKGLQIRELEQEALKATRYKDLHEALMKGFENFKTNYGMWRSP